MSLRQSEKCQQIIYDTYDKKYDIRPISYLKLFQDTSIGGILKAIKSSS